MTKAEAIRTAVDQVDKDGITKFVIRRGDSYEVWDPISGETKRGWRTAEIISIGNVHNYRAAAVPVADPTAVQKPVRQFAEELSDAYSTDYYVGGWSGAIVALRKRGYDDREIEAIIRSKWTRWAVDNYGGRQITGAEMLRYFYSCSSFHNNEIRTLVEETFVSVDSPKPTAEEILRSLVNLTTHPLFHQQTELPAFDELIAVAREILDKK